MTIEQARRAVAIAFRGRGIETPELDARILLGHALALDHAGLVMAAARALVEVEAAQISALAARRLAGEPVARILGQREFWGLPLIVTPAVLVPRPETETVVELALSLIGDIRSSLRIADLGTGSGAILIALLSELPNASGVGTDLVADALDVARANARNLRLEARTTFLNGEYGSALAGPFDLVVSNPPYIASRDIETLGVEVRDHDPRRALDGGADGLDAYRAIAADARRLIGQGCLQGHLPGHLVVEIGAGQSRDVERLFAEQGLAIMMSRHDLSGRIRALAAGWA